MTAFDRERAQWRRLGTDECRFAYRDSLFKQYPGRFVISQIHLRLSRSQPLRLEYQELRDYLADCPVSSLDALAVAQAVMAIRRRKLPGPGADSQCRQFFQKPCGERGGLRPGSSPGIRGCRPIRNPKASNWRQVG